MTQHLANTQLRPTTIFISHLKEKLCSKIETVVISTTAALGSPGELLSFGEVSTEIKTDFLIIRNKPKALVLYLFP